MAPKKNAGKGDKEEPEKKGVVGRPTTRPELERQAEKERKEKSAAEKKRQLEERRNKVEQWKKANPDIKPPVIPPTRKEKIYNFQKSKQQQADKQQNADKPPLKAPSSSGNGIPCCSKNVSTTTQAQKHDRVSTESSFGDSLSDPPVPSPMKKKSRTEADGTNGPIITSSSFPNSSADILPMPRIDRMALETRLNEALAIVTQNDPNFARSELGRGMDQSIRDVVALFDGSVQTILQSFAVQGEEESHNNPQPAADLDSSSTDVEIIGTVSEHEPGEEERDYASSESGEAMPPDYGKDSSDG